MQNQYTPDPEDQSAQKKKSQQRLLLILLLLLSLFVYLYFFTGMIRPLPEKAAEAPPAAPAQPAADVVKQPLPPRPPASAEAPAGTPGSADATAGKPEAAAPATPGAPAPAAPPVSAKATAGKPAASPAAKSAAKPDAAAPAKPAAKPAAQPAAPASAKATAGKPAAKPESGTKPAAPAKEAKKASAKTVVAAAKPAGKGAAAKSKPANGVYALQINEDLTASEVQSVTAKLKKAGITNVVTTKAQKGEPMHRLFLADFADRNEAAEELARLKQVAPNAFMLKENSRYAVYAGSFLRQGKAAVEQDRLYDKGVRLVLREATIPLSVVKLRAGNFPDPVTAEKAAVSLKKTGLSAHVIKVGK